MKAKNFQLIDFRQKLFDLYAFQKKDFLFLVFFRGLWCNQCKKQLLELNNNFAKFKKMKIKIVSLSTDSPLNTSILFTYLKSKFPLLSDQGWKIFKMFGFKKTASKKIKPAVFLINPKKEIVYSYVGQDKDDRPTIKELLKVCKKLTAVV